MAWRQRQEAKRLLRDVRKQLGQVEPPSVSRRLLQTCLSLWKKDLRSGRKTVSTASSPATVSSASRQVLKPEWTLVHAFYAVMGGFAMDCSGASEAFLPGSRTRAALTVGGLRFLLEHELDLLPDISEVRDIAKLIVESP